MDALHSDDPAAALASEPVGTVSQFARLRNALDEAHASQPSLASDEVLGAILQTAITLTGAERGYLILRAGEDLEVRLGRVAGSGELSPTMSIP